MDRARKHPGPRSDTSNSYAPIARTLALLVDPGQHVTETSHAPPRGGRIGRSSKTPSPCGARLHIQSMMIIMRLIGIPSGMIPRHHRRSAGASESAGKIAGEISTMAHDALHTILPIAGWPEERARSVEISGGSDPVLPTPFRIGAAGAAALAATGLASADLWELRTGRRQEVAVDLRQAVASLRSGHYLQVNGAKVRNDRNPVMGMYPAKNGQWSYIHANFPNHRAAALRVLGCEEDKEAVRQAVAKWDALELEEAIIAAKGAGGMVRGMAEWAEHPQAAAIAALPLMEIVKIG